MANSNHPRSFIVTFLALTLGAMVVVAAINIIVDPFWRFDLVNIPGFNAQRAAFPTHARLAKAGVMCRLQPTTVAIGTSRVEVGIDPTHPGFGDVRGSVYNLALAGAGLHELDLTLRHAVHASPGLKRVLLGLDFLMFNAYREAVVFKTEVLDFDQDRLLLSRHDTCLRSMLYDINDLLGPKALIYSAATIANEREEPSDFQSPDVMKWIANYERNGLRSNFYILDKVQLPRKGYRGLFGTGQERYYSARIWRPAPAERYCFSRDGKSSTFATLRGIVKFARAHGIDLRIFINPVHARLLVALRQTGLWPMYEEWKQGIVGVLAEEAAADGEPPFPLWDFSGFNSVTMEHVPAAADHTTIMLGFWEPSHYKKQIGDLMLNRMLDYSEPGRAVPDDFGVMLTPASIDGWIVKSRAAMRDYMRAEPVDTALVEEVVDKAMAGGDGANCGFDVQALREASAARSRGDAEAAGTAIAHAISLHEADRRHFASLDVPYREVGFDRMLAQVQAGIELKQPLENWIAYQERGIERSEKGDYLGAADDFGTAIRIGPVNTALYFLRGVALLHAGENADAAVEFENGLRLEPENATLISLLQQARRAVPQDGAKVGLGNDKAM